MAATRVALQPGVLRGDGAGAEVRAIQSLCISSFFHSMMAWRAASRRYSPELGVALALVHLLRDVVARRLEGLARRAASTTRAAAARSRRRCGTRRVTLAGLEALDELAHAGVELLGGERAHQAAVGLRRRVGGLGHERRRTTRRPRARASRPSAFAFAASSAATLTALAVGLHGDEQLAQA